MAQHKGNDVSCKDVSAKRSKVEAAQDKTFERLFHLPGDLWWEIMGFLGVGDRFMVLETDIKHRVKPAKPPKLALKDLLTRALEIDQEHGDQNGKEGADSLGMPGASKKA